MQPNYHAFILPFHSFHRFSLQMIPVISSLTPYTTVVPLFLVLALTAAKDAYDDWVNHKFFHFSCHSVVNLLTGENAPQGY